jgi:hypothetical protein
MLRTTAQQLNRLAGDLQESAGEPDAREEAPAALAEVEQALERLENAFTVMAGAIADQERETEAGEAEALRWHLSETASRLAGAAKTCGASRRWSRHLLYATTAGAQPRRRPAEAARDRIPLCHVQRAAGQDTLSAVVDEVTLTYEVVATDPDGNLTYLRRHLPSLRDARRWALKYAASAADHAASEKLVEHP